MKTQPTKSKTDLKGKTIIITGASSGVGRATALQFAQHSTKLVLASRNEDVLREVSAECEALGARTLVVPTDVTDSKAVIALANAANNWSDTIDIWINNAGVLAAGPFDEMPMALHEQVIKTNLLGYMNGAHAVMPYFKKQQAGILINNISIGGYVPVPYGTGYTASKFALRGFSEALKGELAARPNIHVCDLFPAFLDTPGVEHAGNYTGKVLKPAPPVYDPQRVAQAMVALARSPTSTKYVGSVSTILKLGHSIFPELMTNITGKIMRTYFSKASDIAKTNGNIFNTVDYDMTTHGRHGIPGKPRAHRKYLAAAAVLALGVFLMRR